jgi:glycosyltransferase involved in cell wall biosynthesis
MPTKVSFFFDSGGLSRPWSFDVTAQALSGTDAIFLELANALESDPGFDVTFYATNPPSIDAGRVVVVVGFLDAVDQAERRGEEFLIFVAISDAIQCSLLSERRRSGPKLIAWAQCSPSFEWMTCASRAPRFFRLIAVSNIERAFFAHHALYRQTVVIPNFLDFGAWAANSRDTNVSKQVVYIGALKPSKGFHHLARAWPSVRASHPDWSLTVCGSPGLYGRTAQLGPEGIAEEAFERQILAPLGGTRASAEALGVGFAGSLSKQDLAETVRASAVAVVNPNMSRDGSIETFCVSAAEAMALGVPVVGGAAGGLLEVVAHGEGGLLAKNESELGAALARLMDDPALRERLGRNGRARVERLFDKSIAIDRWKALLSGHRIAADTLPFFKFTLGGYYLRVVFGWLLPMGTVQFVREARRRISTALRG